MTDRPATLPVLDNLVKVFFGQDMDLFGDSVEAVLDAFVDSSGPDDWQALRREIAAFAAAHPAPALDAAFDARWGDDFSPARWDLDAAGFLAAVDARIAQAAAPGG